MKRKLLAGILAGTMILSMAGCGNTSSPLSTTGENSKSESENSTPTNETNTVAEEGKTTIQFWNSFTGTDGDVLRDLVEIYNKTNKKGNTVEMDIMPTASLEEKLPAAIASKTAPALVIKGNFDVATYGDNKIFQSTDDFFDTTGTDKEDFSTASLEALQYNGSQLMIPMQVHSTFLFWNKDLFKAAGLDPEKAPTTWEEVAAYAAKITDDSKKIYGVGLPISGAPCYFDAMFKSNGGDVVSEDGKSSILDSSENLATLQYIQDLVKAGYAPKGATGADTDNLMLAGQLGIYCSGPWLVSGLKENDINFGVTAMPSGTKQAAGVIEVQGFGVTSTCTEAEKAAAYDFIAFWNTTETCKAWSLRNGFPPYLKSVAKDKEVQADPIVNALSSISEFGFSFAPGVKAANQINADVLFPLIENVSSGNDCQTELTNASEKVNKLLGN